MEIKFSPLESKKEGTKKGLIEKFTFILFGIFLASLVFAFSLQIFGEETYNIYIGLFLNTLLAGCGIYKTKKGSGPRLISYGIAGIVVFSIIGYIVALSTIKNLLEGF